jgi:glycosyltransferase involved in cell wall biosynthesis
MLIWMLGLMNKTPSFIYILDLYPDTFEGLFPRWSRLVSKFWRTLNRKSIIAAEKTFVVSKSMADQVFLDYGVKTEVLAPWSSLFIKDLPAKSKNHITIVYAGNIGLTHDFGPLLWLAKNWRREENLCIQIIGQGFQKKKLVNELKLTKANIVESGYVNHDELKRMLSKAHFAYLSTASGFESSSIPSKIYTYCGAGLPLIVSTSHDSLLRDIVIENKLGLVVADHNFDDILEAIDDILESSNMMFMTKNNVRYAKKVREETLSKLP